MFGVLPDTKPLERYRFIDSFMEESWKLINELKLFSWIFIIVVLQLCVINTSYESCDRDSTTSIERQEKALIWW